jgi:hypothetical protein
MGRRFFRNTQQRNLSKALHVRPQGLQCIVHSADQQEFLMAKEPKKLDELFHDTLKDIYFLLCGKEDSCDAAEDGESRAIARSEEGPRKAPRRNRRPCRAA